jgi:dCMP deaminase
MERISREQMLMEVAEVVARRGTCSRAQVGVVFARDGRILATGYNGAPRGMAHCVHLPDETEGCKIVEHAERNAIAYAAREGIRLGDSDAYCTHAPCLDCARSLLNVGIGSLRFKVPYRLTAGVELLRAQGIEVIDLSSSKVV